MMEIGDKPGFEVFERWGFGGAELRADGLAPRDLGAGAPEEEEVARGIGFGPRWPDGIGASSIDSGRRGRTTLLHRRGCARLRTAEQRGPLNRRVWLCPYAFFTNSDFSFMAPNPSMWQSML